MSRVERTERGMLKRRRNRKYQRQINIVTVNAYRSGKGDVMARRGGTSVAIGPWRYDSRERFQEHINESCISMATLIKRKKQANKSAVRAWKLSAAHGDDVIVSKQSEGATTADPHTCSGGCGPGNKNIYLSGRCKKQWQPFGKQTDAMGSLVDYGGQDRAITARHLCAADIRHPLAGATNHNVAAQRCYPDDVKYCTCLCRVRNLRGRGGDNRMAMLLSAVNDRLRSALGRFTPSNLSYKRSVYFVARDVRNLFYPSSRKPARLFLTAACERRFAKYTTNFKIKNARIWDDYKQLLSWKLIIFHLTKITSLVRGNLLNIPRTSRSRTPRCGMITSSSNPGNDYKQLLAWKLTIFHLITITSLCERSFHNYTMNFTIKNARIWDDYKQLLSWKLIIFHLIKITSLCKRSFAYYSTNFTIKNAQIPRQKERLVFATLRNRRNSESLHVFAKDITSAAPVHSGGWPRCCHQRMIHHTRPIFVMADETLKAACIYKCFNEQAKTNKRGASSGTEKRSGAVVRQTTAWGAAACRSGRGRPGATAWTMPLAPNRVCALMDRANLLRTYPPPSPTLPLSSGNPLFK
ncbi:hypothetical protein J6590_049616 [Homalodisca vitripennis]|nr:hypothetical protein J6590_049616 [Homalodisca vitripennis]